MLPKVKVLDNHHEGSQEPQDELLTLRSDLTADIEELEILRAKLDEIKKTFLNE